MKRRVGIFSGTFDPVHAGHLTFVREAYVQCHLSTIVIFPDPSPPGKMHVTSYDVRLNALHEAFVDEKNIEIWDITPSTRLSLAVIMPLLHKRFIHAEYTLLIGSDVAQNLHKWFESDTFFRNWELAVGLRGSDTIEQLNIVLSQAQKKVQYITTAHANTSSRQLRDG